MQIKSNPFERYVGMKHVNFGRKPEKLSEKVKENMKEKYGNRGKMTRK